MNQTIFMGNFSSDSEDSFCCRLKNSISCPDVTIQSNNKIDEEAIREKAYYLWEAAGKPDCDGLEFWLEAKNSLC